jgi:hypothetical protein
MAWIPKSCGWYTQSLPYVGMERNLANWKITSKKVS